MLNVLNMHDLKSGEQQTQSFAETIVTATTGFKIEEIPKEERAEILANCLNLFKDFIFDYTNKVYGQKDMLRLKAMYSGDQTYSFEKNPDLAKKFDEAYKAYLENLNNTWK